MIPAVWTANFIEREPETLADPFARQGWRNRERADEYGAALLPRGDPEAPRCRMPIRSARLDYLTSMPALMRDLSRP